MLVVSGDRKKLLLKVCQLLLLNIMTVDKVKLSWEKDLSIGFTEEQWHRSSHFNLTFSGNVNIQENRFKIMNRRYVSSGQLKRMFPQTEGKCWRCQGDG